MTSQNGVYSYDVGCFVDLMKDFIICQVLIQMRGLITL